MTTITPPIKQLDEIRATGYKPTVVVCVVSEQQILMLFKKEYNLWMLPQSGLDPKDDMLEKSKQVIVEELGQAFTDTIDFTPVYLGEDQVEFLPEKQTGEEISVSDGSKSFKMVGKHYYFFSVAAKSMELNLKDTIYDEYYWLASKPALALASKIYQLGKRRITMKAITLLKEQNLVG